MEMGLEGAVFVVFNFVKYLDWRSYEPNLARGSCFVLATSKNSLSKDRDFWPFFPSKYINFCTKFPKKKPFVHFTLDFFWSPGCKNYQKKKTKQNKTLARRWRSKQLDHTDHHPSKHGRWTTRTPLKKKASALSVSHKTQRPRRNAPPGDVPKHNGP